MKIKCEECGREVEVGNATIDFDADTCKECGGYFIDPSVKKEEDLNLNKHLGINPNFFNFNLLMLIIILCLFIKIVSVI